MLTRQHLINILALYLLFGFAAFVAVATAQPILPTIAAGQVIERQMKGGETHSFQVRLEAGQYLRTTAEQRGIDIELAIINPAGEKLVQTDSLNSTQGPEIAATIAEQTGDYQIAIISPGKSAPPGSYELQITAPQTASEQNRLWLNAQHYYLTGKQQSEQAAQSSQEEALKSFAEALRIWQVQDDQLMVAHTLYYLAAGYRRLGQTQHALVYYGYALQIVRAAQQQREAVTALTSLAIVLSELGESRKALEYYEQALIQWRAFNDAFGEAQTLINLGLVNAQLGEPGKALENYDRAYAVWLKLGNRQQMADTLNRLGLTYDNLGEWQKSLEYYSQASAIYRDLNNRRGEATTLNNLGLLFVRMGETRKALDYYNQSLTMWRVLGNRREEANTLTNIGLAESQLKNTALASASYQQALKLWREAGDRRGEARTLQRMGDLEAATANSERALALYDQALPLLRLAGDVGGESSVLLGLGELYLAQVNPLKAREYFTQAQTTLESMGNRMNEAQAIYGLARVERALGNLQPAREHIESALTKVEKLRTNVGSQQLRASYLATVHKYYELNLSLLMQLHKAAPNAGYDALAIQANERARARSLLELLTEARANIREGVDINLLDREEKLAQQLDARAQQLLRMSSQRGNELQINELKQEISRLEDEYNQVEVAIRKSSPRFAALTQPKMLSLAEIQALLDQDSLLLEYSIGEECSWLWAVTRNSIHSFELPQQSVIETASLQYRELLLERNRRLPGESPRQYELRHKQHEAKLLAAASTLSQIVLSPIAERLGNLQLIIVADGALQYVPFAAIPEPSVTNNGQPLVVSHEIITLPSASTLAVLRQELTHRPPTLKTLAVFADPVFSVNDARLRTIAKSAPAQSNNETSVRDIIHEAPINKLKLSADSLIVQRLPYTRQEADQILALVPKDKSYRATDFKASRTAALSAELSQFRYLHFATHGLIDNERPGLSSLVLTLVDEQGKAQDGFLRAQEIYNLQLPAELVVLSACQTGLGKQVRGEGLVGLTRSFMYAGAPRVVVSLWNVNDKATAELMTRFYQQILLEGKRPAAALRAAQIQMWQQKQWQSPYYWAAFVLQGEWR